jgi:hypothetical protein
MAGFDWVGPAASCHVFKMVLSRSSDGVGAWADPQWHPALQHYRAMNFIGE